MDKLDTEIAAKKDSVARMKRQIETAEIELRVLEYAASLRPASLENQEIGHVARSMAHALPDSGHRGGRQPGSISRKWREVLALWVAHDQNGNKWLDMDGIHLLQRPFLGLAPSSTRERIRQYADVGHVEELDGKYRVSQTAIEKFSLLDLRKEKPQTDDRQGFSRSNGAEASASETGFRA